MINIKCDICIKQDVCLFFDKYKKLTLENNFDNMLKVSDTNKLTTKFENNVENCQYYITNKEQNLPIKLTKYFGVDFTGIVKTKNINNYNVITIEYINN